MITLDKQKTKYDKYKPTGIDWIGDIPVNWETRKLKFILSKIESGSREQMDDEAFSSEEKIPSIGGEHVGWDGKLNFTGNKFISKEYFENFKKGILNRFDILLVKDGATIGKCAFVDEMPNEKMAINEHVYLMRSNENLLQKLLYYFIISDHGQKQILLDVRGSAQGGLNTGFTGKTFFSLPFDLKDQQAIVNYLDDKTALIDNIISLKHKQIDLLKERKNSLINSAVTKGLDKNVEMVDSGIEWIGEIPKSWCATKLKFLTTKIVDGAHFTPTYVDKGVPFLRVTDIQEYEINMENLKYIPEEEHKELIKRCKPEKGDLLLSKNGTIGIPKVVHWDWEFSIFVSLCLLKLNNNLSPYFLEYFFYSTIIKEQINSEIKQSTVINLHLEKIKEFIVTLPSLDEQESIVKYLSFQTNKIDKTIATVEKSIGLLSEYKQSLVSNVVTGKVRVF